MTRDIPVSMRVNGGLDKFCAWGELYLLYTEIWTFSPFSFTGKTCKSISYFHVQGCPNAFYGGTIQTKVRQVTVIVLILQVRRQRHRKTCVWWPNKSVRAESSNLRSLYPNPLL